MVEQPKTNSTALSPEEVMRYSRHIIMAQVGPQGQRKLRNAKVLVIGAGGLGGPVALYLALAGVLGLASADMGLFLPLLAAQLLAQREPLLAHI